MITRKEIRRVLAGTSRYQPPVLSLYMNVNPAEPDHSPKALATRAKSTLDGLPVPPAVAERVIDKLADGTPKGKTAVVFADESRSDLFLLSVDLPLEDTASGRAESRWGKPYVTPLLIAVDENEHYGVVHVDRDHIRVFEVSFGGVESISSGSRLKKASELDTEVESRRMGRPYVPVRGDASEQLANEHVRELSRLYYIEAAKQIGARLDERDLSRLILVGPTEDTHRLERELPPALAERIALRLPSFTYRRAPEAEVRERLAPALVRLRDEREGRLIDQVAERGIAGIDQSLYALQEGRLQALLVPWPLHATIYRDRRTGYHYPIEAEADLDPVPLADALPELSSAFNVKLEFVLGAARDRLHSELGGLAGLTRW